MLGAARKEYGGEGMTASSLRIAHALLLHDAVPLSIALEVMGQPSAKLIRCAECGRAIESRDVRRIICSEECTEERRRKYDGRRGDKRAPRHQRNTAGRR